MIAAARHRAALARLDHAPLPLRTGLFLWVGTKARQKPRAARMAEPLNSNELSRERAGGD
jgi:hypothetical protein